MASPATNYHSGLQSPTTPAEEAKAVRFQRRYDFPIATDPMQEDRATEIKLLSFQRPHMRAFHFAWLSFFIAFFGWFSIPPLMPTIKKQLHLTSDQVANSNIMSVSSTILGRVIAGPMCDRYGSRTVQAVLLVVGAIPVASAAFVTNYTSFMAVRFAIGLVGCSFVATAYWTSVMFSKQVVGSANALAAGWGNLGAGATYLITPFIFDLVTINGSVSDNTGWRITLIVPAVFMVIVGICLYYYSDDCPQGNYSQLKKFDEPLSDAPVKAKMDMKKALLVVAKMPVTWILAFQYACSFGVELQVHNVLSLYYYEDFTKAGCDAATDASKCRMLTQTKASLISSLFGLMCIFARYAGGYASDLANSRFEMKGRICIQFVVFAGQAVFLYLYSRLHSLSWSIPCLVIFGIFVQACTGSTYGIVPYVAPKFTGATSGVVGAGGNVGGLCWGFLFKGVVDRRKSFRYLSIFVAVAAVLSAGIQITGERTVWGKDNSVHGSTAATECGEDNDVIIDEDERDEKAKAGPLDHV
ncbi:Sporangia induced major facilitator superfamily, partial [Globisporangium splendens]